MGDVFLVQNIKGDKSIKIVAPENLIAWYTFEGNGNDITANDSRFADQTNYSALNVTNITFLPTGGVGNTDLKINPSGAYQYTGSTTSGSRIQLPANVHTQNWFSISFWVYWNTLSGSGISVNNWPQTGVIFINGQNNIQDEWAFHQYSGGGVLFGWGSAGYERFIYKDNAVTTGRWYHFAQVLDQPNGIQRLYIDGVEAVQPSQGTRSSGSGGALFNSNTLFNGMGRGQFVNTNEQYTLGGHINQWNFLGRIDDLRYYNKVLSADEVLKIYENSRVI